MTDKFNPFDYYNPTPSHKRSFDYIGQALSDEGGLHQTSLSEKQPDTNEAVSQSVALLQELFRKKLELAHERFALESDPNLLPQDKEELLKLHETMEVGTLWGFRNLICRTYSGKKMPITIEKAIWDIQARRETHEKTMLGLN